MNAPGSIRVNAARRARHHRHHHRTPHLSFLVARKGGNNYNFSSSVGFLFVLFVFYVCVCGSILSAVFLQHVHVILCKIFVNLFLVSPPLSLSTQTPLQSSSLSALHTLEKSERTSYIALSSARDR